MIDVYNTLSDPNQPLTEAGAKSNLEYYSSMARTLSDKSLFYRTREASILDTLEYRKNISK